jgi:hypothetical protein
MMENFIKKGNSSGTKKKMPWHLLMVGLVFIFIYLIGLYDYIMIHLNNIEYMQSLNVKGDIVEYFSNYPIFYSILWTINVFGGLVAAILLFFRKKWATIISLLVVFSKFFLDALTFLFRSRWEVFGVQASLADIMVLLISIGFFVYCRAMVKRGVLI